MAYLRLQNKHTGEILELRRHTTNGQQDLELRGTVPPNGDGPPMHIHYSQDEEGMVTTGTLSVEVGGRRIDANAGEKVMLPRGIPHRWWNQSDQPLAFHGRVTPVDDLDKYLQAIFEIMNAGPKNRPPLFYLAHASLRHRRTQAVLVMPLAIQAVLFRMLVVLGTVMGRYRGTEWPGCPARCTGAPEA